MNDCSWVLGTPCGGKITRDLLFSRGLLATGLEVNICENHLNEHNIIIALHRAGFEITELMNKSPEERQRLYEQECKKKQNNY